MIPAGTVIVIFFGSVFNLLTRTWMLVDMRERPKEPVDGNDVAVAAAAASEDRAVPVLAGQNRSEKPMNGTQLAD